MKIAVDLRSLQGGGISGVENYIINTVEHLLSIDHENQYVFFDNAFRGQPSMQFQYVNSHSVHSRWPNKFLNASLKLFKRPNFERLAGDFDVIFIPNANQFSVSKLAYVVMTVHDLSPVVTPHFYSLKRRLWHRFLNYKKMYERANALVAISEFTKNSVVEKFNINPEKISVVYPGVGHSIFNPQISDSELRIVRNRYGLPRRFVLFVSTLEPRKNLTGLISALENLDEPTHLVIAGKLGWKYGPIIKALKNSSKKRFIHYLGYIHESDKPALLKLARLVVYPSFYEGFGFVPLEAMAVGTPVITSQNTSLPEVVAEAGLMINPYNISDLAFAMRELLNNEGLRQQLITKGSQRAQSFGWDKSAAQLLKIITKQQ